MNIEIDIDTPDLEKKCKELFDKGYGHPIVTTKVNNKKNNKDNNNTPKIVFKKIDKSCTDIESQKQMLMLTMRNVLRAVKANKANCSIEIQLSKKAIDYLYNQTRFVKFQFGTHMEQREISGQFSIKSSKNELVFVLDVDEASVQRGDKESAAYIEAFGTFHTHPYDAYKKYDVCIAWPSADDYISFLYMYGLCCSGFHMVSTLEGIYLISLKKYIPPQKVMKEFEKYKDRVEYHHGVDYPETDNYCNIEKGKINRKKINNYVKKINKKGMFNLVFIPWEECKNQIKLKYAAVDNNCLLSNEQGQISRTIL